VVLLDQKPLSQVVQVASFAVVQASGPQLEIDPQATQRRSLVALGGVAWYWVALHCVSGLQTRSTVSEGAVNSYSPPPQVVHAAQLAPLPQRPASQVVQVALFAAVQDSAAQFVMSPHGEQPRSLVALGTVD